MILDRSRALVARVATLQERRSQSRQVRDVRDVAQALSRGAGRLAAHLPTVELFARRGVGRADVAAQAAAVFVQVQAAIALAKSEPRELTNRDRLKANDLDDDVADVAHALDGQLNQLWEGFAAQIPPLDMGVLTTLANLPPLRDWAGRVRVALTRVQELRLRRPRTDAELDAFLDAVKRLQAVHAEFGADLPPALLDFIRAAAAGGFALPMYTAELTSELRRRGWEQYFTIRVRAGA